ncbi:dUTP diphosphatase [Pueribacillus theae]|uniref:dUTP diphosphatase n=1 Tax=Pueribacillus theae TaxID=2171751 RepID=A0A2U1K0R8_9BACI|nr:dUTP diphosphatase [Pueribacillus theae]PWA11087.1 dUTP diphosphatase [Pueribacillus theae]
MSKARRLRVKAKPEDFERQHDDDAGFDLRAKEEVTLIEGKPKLVKTNVFVEIPKNHVGLVMIRSSLGMKGITLANSVGVIDSGYRGEVGLIMVSLSGNQTVFAGDRVAQMLIVPLQPVNVEYVKQLKGSERGEGGFGSTGKS